VSPPPLSGTPIERREDPRLLRGEGRFADDLDEGAGVAHVAFVRSEHAHARVTGIDLSGALDVEGVIAVYAADDLDGRFAEPLPVVYPHPALSSPRTPAALAGDEVCHLGQPLAMVLATSRYLAEDAAAAIRVDYQPLPVAIDLEAAAGGAQGPAHLDMADNLAAAFRAETGDVDAAMRGAAHVIERRFVCERASGAPLETRSVQAHDDQGSGRLVVTDTTQVPMSVRRFLAERFAMDPEDVEVRVPDVGGGFGTKGFRLYPEELLVPWAARRLGRPVKWVEDRREHFIGSTHQRSQIHDVRVGCDADGRIVALEVCFLHDMGAWSQLGLLLPLVAGSALAGPYTIPNLRYEFRAIYTNTMQTSPYRGAGNPFGNFVIERTVDAVAAELGMDRAEVRRRNFIPKDAFPYDVGLAPALGSGTVTYDSGDYERGLDLVLDAIGWHGFERERAAAAAQGRRLGIGLAACVEGSGVGPYESAKVSVRPDGCVVVATGAASTGQGHETTLAQLVADVLELPVEQVVVARADTRRLPSGFGTYGSRVAVVAGTAATRAARAVRAKALRLAAHQLQVPEAALRYVGGTVQVRAGAGEGAGAGDDAGEGESEWVLSLADLAAASANLPPPTGDVAGLSVTETFAPPGATFSSGTHACVVEIDPDTYDLRVLRYVAQHDCGTVINPMIVAGQVVGGVAHGIADAFYERRVYDERGQLLNASFMDYLMPYATEIPAVRLLHTSTPSPLNELGAKGSGEGGTIPVAATIISALEDALGVPIDRTPQSPLTLFELDAKKRCHDRDQ